MAKVRVYELARELNMESKSLVEKLLASGMNIKNYMSTLDEGAAQRAREIVSGVVSEVIEEKRIKSTVIRRRKKRIRVEEEAPKAEPSAGVDEVKAESPAPPPPPGEMPSVEIKEEPEKVPEAAEVRGKEEVPEAPVEKEKPSKPAREVKPKPKKAKKRKGDEPAKIIKRPEEGPLGDALAKKEEKEAPPVKPPEKKVEPLWPREVGEKPAEEEEQAKPVKKKKAKKKGEDKEALAKKAIRHRRKEVYERADLYEARALRYKDKRAAKKSKELAKRQKHTEITVPKASKRRIRVQEAVTVAELSRAMGIKATELLKRLLEMGVAAHVNKAMDFETASLVADEFGYELELDTFEEQAFIAETEDQPEDLQPRPPVVTIMGHVDHGKTSLLDYVRKSNITDGEFGGITQHIGAYYVQTKGGDIVFLDTPGHEAFTAMRARGAKVTDLIVLVVAADDGVMPQTKEAINHARAANIPILVAVNKIDKPEANPEKVKRELAELDLVPEGWGGETILGHISAKTGEGVEDLLGLILLQAEMLELQGNPNKPARGTIIEAKLDKNKGSVATVLVKNGTLHKGDYFICGNHHGRVRAMVDHRSNELASSGPSMPVEVYGISGVPMAGDEFIVVKDEKTAKEVIEHRKDKDKKQEIVKRGLISLDELFDRIKEGEVKELDIILKADVQGSIEALKDSLVKLSTEEVKLKIIHAATGAIAESDVMLASASGAVIIGFNVRANPRVREVAERENVDIRYYDVIYNVVKDIRLAMVGLLEPVYKERVIGRADVREVFRIPKVGAVAGCYVTDGRVARNAKVRLLRDEVVIFDGNIASLRRFKEDAKEVQSGYECGIGLENFQDIKEGDVLEVYEVEEVQAEL